MKSHQNGVKCGEWRKNPAEQPETAPRRIYNLRRGVLTMAESESKRIIMTGNYQHTIDAKGRLFLPAKMRKYFEGETVYVVPGFGDYIMVLPSPVYISLLDELDKIPNQVQRDAMRMFFNGNTSECELDGQGRIVIPLALKDRFGLGKDVTVVGTGKRLEIWDPEKWRASVSGVSMQDVRNILEANNFMF